MTSVRPSAFSALRELPELDVADHVTVSAAERQNNLIEQSHRPTRDQERQQRGFKTVTRTQALLLTHAEVSNLSRYTRASTPARLLRSQLRRSFAFWGKLLLAIA